MMPTKVVAASILNYLNATKEKQTSQEKQDTLEVAIQCLEVAFEVSADDLKNTQSVDIENLILNACTDETQKRAEDHKNRGNDFMKENKFELAIHEYTQAITLNPNDAVFFCNRAAAYTRLEKYKEAILDCKDAVRLNPRYGKAHARLALAYTSMNMLHAARMSYDDALKCDPTNESYKANKASVEQRILARGPPPPPPRNPGDTEPPPEVTYSTVPEGFNFSQAELYRTMSQIFPFIPADGVIRPSNSGPVFVSGGSNFNVVVNESQPNENREEYLEEECVDEI